MRKFLLSMVVAAVSLLPAICPAANSYGIPDKIQDGNILHCFNWTFTDIQKELPNIAAAGFGAVQVSPVQGNCATNAEWFYAYMPYDFIFKANGNGSREQLKSLCSEAAKYGIKIIVDVVANHVNQARGYHDSWWDANGRVRWNGGIDYNNRYSITHNQLGEYGDVNSEAADVQARAKAFIEDLKSLGVAGIRWDAAKHIGLPSESCNFWSEMAKVPGLWHYGEILDNPGGDKYKLLKEYTNYIGVTDSEYSKWNLEEINRGNVPSGAASWGFNGVPANAIVLWAESHDDYSNDGQYGTNTALIPQDKMDRAYAIAACRNNETALYFSRPAATSRVQIKMGQKGSTHFTSKEVAEVNKFRNAMQGLEDYYSASNGVASITRKGGGAVIVVGAGGSRNVSVPNGGSYVPAGTYTDRISGNKFTVTSSTITGQTGSTGIAVIYGEVTRDPSVTLSPEGGEFNNTLQVTLTPNNCKTAWYQLGTAARTTLTTTTTITIGATMQVGESVTLSWSATNNKGVTKTGSATYKKVEKVVPQNAYVYFDNTNNWRKPTVWAWSDSENCTASGNWPGDAMTRQSDGTYIWTAPDGKVPTQIIFSDNGSSQTADLTFVNGKLFKPDGTYSDYSGSNNPTPNPPTPSDLPETLYIIGNLNSGSWNTSVGVQMFKNGNEYVADKVTFEPAFGETLCFFNLSERLADSWEILNSTADRFGATEEGVPLELNGQAALKKYSKATEAAQCKSWTIKPGEYRLVADLNNMFVKALPVSSTAVEELSAVDSSEPVYFTMQGVRVDNPGHGIYI
ncbi:MAG: starch-binding protein, partial [Muribaculaceae bacterium]|nr:starch-binding protein [Muribaculaceae bacterium]